MSLNAPSKILVHLMVQKIQNYIYPLVLPAFDTNNSFITYLIWPLAAEGHSRKLKFFRFIFRIILDICTSEICEI